MVDNGAFSTVQGWQIDSGLAGVFNPGDSAFAGEAGNGMHKNTLYLINDAIYPSYLKMLVSELSQRFQYKAQV